jgi:hypothetical protein
VERAAPIRRLNRSSKKLSDASIQEQFKKTRLLYQHFKFPGEIRLLTLEPGNVPEPLLCRLEHVRLSEKPEYEAISYTWGTAVSQNPVYIDGQPVEVQRSLFLALQRFRLQDQPRRLWTDALCINQNDIDERSQQVNMMRDIYSHSTSALIRLGDAADDDQQAVEVLKLIDEVGWSTDAVSLEARGKLVPIYSLRTTGYKPQGHSSNPLMLFLQGPGLVAYGSSSLLHTCDDVSSLIARRVRSFPS